MYNPSTSLKLNAGTSNPTYVDGAIGGIGGIGAIGGIGGIGAIGGISGIAAIGFIPGIEGIGAIVGIGGIGAKVGNRSPFICILESFSRAAFAFGLNRTVSPP